MYPSKTDKLYGIFVKNMHEEFEKQGVIFQHKALIKGHSKSAIRKIGRYLIHYFHIILYAFKSDYDLTYFHYYSHHVPIMWLLLGFKKKSWIVNVHGTDIIDLIQNPKIDYFAKKVLKRVDLLVVPSSDFKALIKNHYDFIDQNKIFISPSGGLNLDNFQPEPRKKTHKKIVLGFVSRLGEEKGWKVFLKALTILKQEQFNFSALIIGKGPDEKKIKTKINAYGLTKKTEFFGFVKQTELSKFYNQMDLYIFPTYRESLGLTGLEAMACGKPIIASAISGVKTYMNDGKNGFLFEPGNAHELADKIKEYAALPEVDKVKFQKNARLTAEGYERSAVTKKLIKKLSTLA